MLRIVTEQHGDRYTLSLHGKLTGEWVGELERYWGSIVNAVPAAIVVVVLSDVSFIDADGERLLERMCVERTSFVTSGCMNRYVVENVRRRAGDAMAGRPAAPIPRQRRSRSHPPAANLKRRP